jgi:hypothetical protein
MKLYPVISSLCACTALSLAAVAHGSNARSRDASGSATASAQTYCTELQGSISAQNLRFSGWRCKQGPTIDGRQTILAWVKLTRLGARTNLALIWLAETEPAVDAPVVDLVDVPHYGYEPSNVKTAFRAAAGPSSSLAA